MQYLVFDANVTQRWRRVKEFVDNCTDANFWVDIKRHTRFLLKDTMELAMLDEITRYTNTQRYQRTENRLDYRNGYYYRCLDTELGPMFNIKVPRSRLGLYKTSIFERYQRRQQAVNEAICNVFLAVAYPPEMSQALLDRFLRRPSLLRAYRGLPKSWIQRLRHSIRETCLMNTNSYS